MDRKTRRLEKRRKAKQRPNVDWRRRWRMTTYAVVAGLAIVVFIKFIEQPAPPKQVNTITTGGVETMMSSVPLTTKDIMDLASLPFGEMAKEPTARMNQYQATYESLRGDHAGLQVDIMLQEHDYNNGKPNVLPPSVVKCQRRIMSHLVRSRYDVVVTEGYSLDRMSHDGVREWMLGQARSMGNYLPVEVYEQTYHRFTLRADAALQYMERYPDRHVMGGEDLPLNILHDTLLNYIDTLMLGDPMRPRLLEISEHLRVMRSIMPLARTLQAMRVHGYHRAVIVIGYAHRPELEELMKANNIVGNVYDATR